MTHVLGQVPAGPFSLHKPRLEACGVNGQVWLWQCFCMLGKCLRLLQYDVLRAQEDYEHEQLAKETQAQREKKEATAEKNPREAGAQKHAERREPRLQDLNDILNRG